MPAMNAVAWDALLSIAVPGGLAVLATLALVIFATTRGA